MHVDLPSPSRVAGTLGIVVALLVALSTLGQVSKYCLGHGYLCGAVSMFCLDEELNVPTWYSSFGLVLAAGIVAWIAAAKRVQRDRFRRHWTALALLFLLFSLDETASLHERSIEPLRRILGVGGLLRYAWVVPGMVLVLVVGLCYLRFLWHLPARSRRLFLLSGAVFVGGAIGMEMIGGLEFERFGVANLAYAMTTTVEETLEMAGVVLFIYALLDYIQIAFGRLSLRIGPRFPSAE